MSIPLNDAISVFKVSVPLDLLSYKVSIPLSAVIESPVKSLATLQSRIKLAKALPAGTVHVLYFLYDKMFQVCFFHCIVGWLDVNELEGFRDHLSFCKLACEPTSGSPRVGFTVRVHEDFTWMLLVGGRQLLPSDSAVLTDLPSSLVTGISMILHFSRPVVATFFLRCSV